MLEKPFVQAPALYMYMNVKNIHIFLYTYKSNK